MRLPAPVTPALRRMMTTTSKPSVPLLLSPKELQALPNRRDVVTLDVSWHMPNSPRNANEEFAAGPRLPGARRFDLDAVAETDPKKNPLGLKHMLPTADVFAAAAGKLGITANTHVVVYDTVGVFSAPRGLFTFKAFGHDKVSVLDGGLPRWIEDGEEIEEGPAESYKATEYKGAKLNTDMVKSYEDIVANSEKPFASADVVLDARATGRWTGADPEPRAGMSSGHIPNSRTLPFSSLLKPVADGHPYTSLRPAPELREILVRAVGGEEAWHALLAQGGVNAAGAATERELVFTCGSGMTACVGWLAANIVAAADGNPPPPAAIYDESWTGYASRPESKIVKGDE